MTIFQQKQWEPENNVATSSKCCKKIIAKLEFIPHQQLEINNINICLDKNKLKKVIISSPAIKEILMEILQIKKKSQKEVKSHRKE